MTNVLVVGGGFAGCAISHLLSEKGGFEVTLVERASFLGGGCKTFFYGGHPYTFGPRHFLTRKEPVYEYLNTMCPMKLYEGHRFLTYVEGDQSFYHFPIHLDEVKEMPDSEKIMKELVDCPGADGARNLEEYWLRSVGETLYHKYVEKYSRKMWGIDSNTEITDFGFTPKGVALKTGESRAAWTEAIAGFPEAMNGYDDYFDRATSEINVRLNTEIEAFDMENYRVMIEGEWEAYDMIVSTISPEVILNNAFGELRWAGRDFFKIVMPSEHILPDEVYFLYYANDEPFTRIVEYKKFYDYEAPTTLLGLEIPSTKNKLYPFPMKKDQDIHQQYVEALPERVFSIGRMGTYRYLDIGMIIDQCMELTAEL
jgi:UDP-galactopyranose mutase